MNIQDIHIKEKDFKIIIISDSHTNLSNIRKLKELYPDSQFISLGDLTFLHAKDGEQYNSHSIQYFIDNKIPTLEGNHESFLISAEQNDGLETDRILGKAPEFNLSKEHLNYLKSLPRGFRLILPDGNNYYCFHNEPFNLWNFPDKISEEYFKSNYIFDDRTISVLCGHLHKNQADIFPNIKTTRTVIGQLCNRNHHNGKNNGGNYALLTEGGIELKTI